MKRIAILMAVILLISASMYSGVVKKSKAEVSFKRFGTFSTVSTEQIVKDKKKIDSDSTFKGRGVAGLAAKAFLKSGQTSEIIDLPALTIFQIDHKKKTYRTTPIREFTNQEESAESSDSANSQQTDSADSPEVESSQSVKITRSEFRVEDTGETKVINMFESHKFTITWIREWENIETGEKGKERLLTDVWATPFTNDLQSSLDQENEFTSAYMKKMGFEINALQEQMLGGLAKKVLSKKSTNSEKEPSLTYYTELIELNTAPVNDNVFQVPVDYKKKGN